MSAEIGVPDRSYVELLTRYVDGRQGAGETRQDFYSLLQSDARVGDDERYAILQRVFFACEDLVLDSDLEPGEERDDDEIDEPTFREMLAAAAHDLTHRADDWESRQS